MPVGLLLEIPGVTAEQYDERAWRIYEVWESRQACEEFDELHGLLKP